MIKARIYRIKYGRKRRPIESEDSKAIELSLTDVNLHIASELSLSRGIEIKELLYLYWSECII